ncbi:uncharacterized protein LOC114190171 [Vigna unguiculata]|uniref:Kazal-like domain-containing protein n=1 Tax=Vigna unguiculata TaxID=3917 RepID=A0A4D6N560_VIGUN|nr:uncharacterized protein LOC114190171 [Vigna unguiculata]QCE08032.1 hypothetical protein DEO72_LG9g3056 [Vigna unguiculata]
MWTFPPSRHRFLAAAIIVVALCMILPVSMATQPLKLCMLTTPTPTCPVKCFVAKPVCGEDGVTYWCGCHEAACAGVEVERIGPCVEGNGGSAPIPGQALLLVHIVWLILLGFSVLFGLF